MKHLFAVLGLMLSATAAAQTAAESLTGLLDQNRNIEGEFRQMTNNEQGETVQNSEGVFLLAAPNRFVWDTVTPFPQRIISDGEWVTIWDVDLEQATRKPFSGSVGNSPAALLGESAEDVLTHYEVKTLAENTYQLSPKEQEDLFDTLTLSFDNKKISAMSIKDVLGQTTIIEFANIETHNGVSESNFVVKLPDSVDVMFEQ